MNIGIDFNTKTTKAAFLTSGSNVEDCMIFEIKNVLVFVNGDIFAGNDGFNKFLTEKDSTIYDFDQIIEWNGLIINKKQISTEKCLSIIFAQLLDKIKTHSPNNNIDFVSISIPYDKYYYWNDTIKKAFSLIGVEKIRINSQPAAFFCQPNVDYLNRNLNREFLSSSAVKKYDNLSWYKKLLSKKPELLKTGKSVDYDYLFISISQDNTNVSLVNYGSGVLEVIDTQYTNSITRRKIEHSILDYFISEISKDSRIFAVKDQKTLLRILELVNEFLKAPQTGNTFELNLPYVLCEDGGYRTLDTKIDLEILRNLLAPSFNNLVQVIKELAKKTREAKNIIVLSDSFIQQNIKEILPKVFDGSKVTFGTEKSLSIGALNFSRVMTGENRDFIALEVIPFSVLVRLPGIEFVEIIAKDSKIPTSRDHSFEIKGEGKSKFIEVHLTTKEGDVFQSLNVWKIEVPHLRVFKIMVDIGVLMEIKLRAYSENGEELSVHAGNTFSFSGNGFQLGIKGKDIRQYILNQFNYLSTALEKKDVVIFEPDTNFYSMLRDGDPFKALRYLGHFLKLRSLPDIELTESKFFEEQGIGGFISGSKISIPKYFTNDPHGFGYVLAHELAHYILIHEEQIILDDEQENEILTEIFVIYSGMGKLFLNGFKSKDIEGSLHTGRGYLDEGILKYIQQIYITKFNIDLPNYRKNLTNEGEKMLDELVSNIE